MVSEREIEAAREAWREYWSDVIGQYEDNKGPMEGMRRALEAAARVREEANAGEPVAEALELSGNTGELIDKMAEAIRGDTTSDETPSPKETAMTETTPDYAGLIERLEDAQSEVVYAANRLDDQAVSDASKVIAEALTALRTLLESNAALERERDEYRDMAARKSSEKALLHANWRAAEAERDRLAKILGKVLTWAEQRCPCHNEEPNPCPLCGASVENLEACKSAENTIPASLLADLRTARSLVNGGGDG